MKGAMPLLPLYAFMAWTGKKLPFFLYCNFCITSVLYLKLFANECCFTGLVTFLYENLNFIVTAYVNYCL